LIVETVRRLLSGLVAVLLASLLAFLILEASPGDIIDTLIGDEASQAQEETLRHALALDQPIYIRYLHILEDLAHGNLGVSLVNGRPVARLIGDRFLNTLLLASSAVLLAVFAGLGLGYWSAVNYQSPADLAMLILTTFGLALPSFGVALFLIQLFSVRLGWLPAVGGGSLQHLILPCLSLAVPTAAVITRMVRARMLEEMAKPYVVTALAKGLKLDKVWQKHVLRNALLPALTLVGVQFGYLLGGAFIVETIFAWPGLGRLTVQAIFDQDYPVVLGAVTVSALIFQFINASLDIAHLWIDPRVRAREK
jgi:ABC-type dipeptide/oligopeptide/nickel transport system permease component